MKHEEEMGVDCKCAKCNEQRRRNYVGMVFWLLVSAPTVLCIVFGGGIFQTQATVITTCYLLGLMYFAFRKDFTKSIRF